MPRALTREANRSGARDDFGTSLQWVAGSGAKAVPCFWVFNPVQGRKFDPNGNNVSRFPPELARLSVDHIQMRRAQRPITRSSRPGFGPARNIRDR
jgi:DNA photolyase-like FAD binding protein